MSTDSEITVVIPVYNRAKLVGRAIQSVLAQTMQATQVIVVDDGSTDKTAEVCREYSQSIQYVWQRNSGVSAARNAGIRLAGHPWIAFLDSDDYFTPLHLKQMTVAIRETSGEAFLYFSDIQLSDHGETLWQTIGFKPRASLHLINDASSWVLLERQPMMLQSSVISKRALEIVGGLDESRSIVKTAISFVNWASAGASAQ